MAHPLVEIFADIAAGRYPTPLDEIIVAPPPPGAAGGVFAFPGYHVIAAAVDREWVRERCPPGDLPAPMRPQFLTALATTTGLRPHHLDLVLCAPALTGPPPLELVRRGHGHTHPRVRRALRARIDVRVYETPGGEAVLTLGRGIAGRWEAGFEVAGHHRNRGLGRALVLAARHLIPPGDAIFMQVAPGNTPSVKAILAGGCTPVGAEVLFDPA